MNKRRIILGLMVFVFGLMMTACGDKKNTSNTTNNNTNIPKSFEDNVCDDCVKTYNGTMRIHDKDLYLQAFNYRNGNDITFGGGTVFEQVLGNVAISILEPVAGVAVCAGRIYLTEQIAKWLNIDNFEAECTTEDLDLFDNVGNGGFDDANVNSSYAARIRVRYQNGRAEAVELVVNDNLDNGNDSTEIFYYDRSNIFVNRENTLLLQNSSGSLRFGTTGGRLIGDFK